MSDQSYVGQTIEKKYKLTELLGAGGMGSVYLGTHIIIGKKVAVKILHAQFATDENVVKRFYREAQAATTIGHKSIIDVLDVGITNTGEPFMVMEYLEGESLAGMLKRCQKIDLAAACGILEPVLLGLSAAHEKGIIHRDLKPDNIFLVNRPGEAPEIKLIDFGISKFLREENADNLTQTGTLLGTPAYMSPEQARGTKEIDTRSDIYAIGVIFHEMLCGKTPFTGQNYNDLLINILTSELVAPTIAYPGFPQEAESIVMRALDKDPEKRFETGLEMIEAFKTTQTYGDRISSLTLIASGIKKKSFAGGDLGKALSDPSQGPVASGILDRMSKSPMGLSETPGGWSKNTKDTEAGAQVSSNRGALVVGGLFGVAAILVALVVGIFLLRQGETPKAAVVALSPATPASTPEEVPSVSTVEPSQKVEIELLNLPQGSTVFFGGVRVPKNPFQVEQSTSQVLLRVEKEGFEPFETSVEPKADIDVTVVLKSSQEHQLKEKVSDRSRHSRRGSKKKKQSVVITVDTNHTQKLADAPPKQTKESKKGEEESTVKTIRKGGRDTKFSTDFQ